MSKNSVLLLYGGGGSEHEISLISAQFIEKSLGDEFVITKVETAQDELIELKNYPKFDFVIPCYHGHPGETGAIGSWLEMQTIPYLGARPESSNICFNKVTSKLWFTALGIPNTPYQFLSSIDEIEKAKKVLKEWGAVFVKASNQGSSVGCYRVSDEEALLPALQKAFQLSPYVLLEKEIIGRELEVSAYEYNNKIHITLPGEIVCPQGSHYSYEEKYDEKSSSKTVTVAKDIDDDKIKEIQSHAKKAFEKLKIKDLCRIDFFLSSKNEVLLNEINTFPGMTPISMFPKMMESNGHSFGAFLKEAIYRSL